MSKISRSQEAYFFRWISLNWMREIVVSKDILHVYYILKWGMKVKRRNDYMSYAQRSKACFYQLKYCSWVSQPIDRAMQGHVSEDRVWQM